MYKLLICDNKQLFIDNIHPKFSDINTEVKQIFEQNDDITKLSQFRPCEFLSNIPSIFSKARKLFYKIECVLNSEIPDILIIKVQEYVLDVLTFARYLLLHCELEDEEVACIKKNLQVFKLMVVNITDLKFDTISKLVKSARLSDSLILQYFHLYLDVLWVLYTLGVFDVSHLITQLAYVSFKYYERERKIVPCYCVSKIWLRLQFYLERTNIKLWDYFNEVLSNYDEEFCLSLLSTIAHLQCYDYNGVYSDVTNARVVENLEFLNNKWTILLDNNPSEDKLQLNLMNIKSLLIKIWLKGSKNYFFSTTWDYFYKKVESFEINDDLIDVAKNIKQGVNCDCSYKTFIYILSVHLENHGEHWEKFKRRIYQCLLPVKFKKLSDNGILNMALLCFTISHINLDEILLKLYEALESLPEERQFSTIIWKLYISMIQLNLQNNRSIQVLASKLLAIISNSCNNRKSLHLVATFVSKLDIIMMSSKNHTLNQHILFGNWIKSYMQYCQYTDLCNLLNTLMTVTKNISDEGAWYVYESEFITNILVPLKNLPAMKDPSPGLIGTLAASILNNSPDNLENMIGYFSSETIPSHIMLQFFYTLSKNVNYLGSKIAFDLIKAWFYCGMIGELNLDYTKFIFEMKILRNLNLGTPQGAEDVITFLRALPQCEDREVSKACFNDLDKWLFKHLSTNNKLNTINIYSNMSVVFLNCAHLIYNRSSALCALSKFVDILLLPLDTLRGKRPNSIVLEAIEKTWSTYVKALYAINNSDPYIERILKNIIVRYIPHFQAKFDPLTLIADGDELLSYALHKISIEYFIQSSRPTDEQIFKAITTIIVFLDTATLQNYLTVISVTLLSFFEVYMFKNKKALVLDVIKSITKTDFYKKGLLADVIKVSLITITKKHLAFNTNPCFQLLTMLSHNLRSDVRNILLNIKEEIIVIEGKRGLGFDTSLRQSYHDLKSVFS